MTENYAEAQRNKRDFDRNMKTLARENKMKLHLINTEQKIVGSGLLVRICSCAAKTCGYRVYSFAAFTILYIE